MNEDRSIEVTGEDVEQAVASGLEQLGVGPDDVMVEVLEEPARGMFGLGCSSGACSAAVADHASTRSGSKYDRR